jgi:CDP-diacylglycerol--glycerol-3-phosphate 3-phosphatidyltransferase
VEPNIPEDDRTVVPIAPIDRRSLNLPNLITISRLFLAVIVFALIDYQGYWLTAAGLFVFAATTDALDGYIARKYGLVTTLGRILDPFADKIIVCGSFVFLLGMESKGLDSGVNGWMVVIVIAREMFVSSLRGLLEEQGRDFSADWTGKIKMVLQSVAVTASLISLSPQFRTPVFIQLRDILLWSAVVLTAYSGAAYLGRMIRMLKSDAAGQSS